MNSTDEKIFDVTNNIQLDLERASRYWRPEFYSMPAAQVAAERRDRAIIAVKETIDWFLGEPENADEMAILVVDNSEFACMGFEALNTTPRTAVGRWLAYWW